MENNKSTALYGIILSITALVSCLMLFKLRWLDASVLFSWTILDDYTSSFRLAAMVIMASLLAVITSIGSTRFLGKNAIILFVIGFCLSLPFWMMPQANNDYSKYFSQAKTLAEHGVSEYVNMLGGVGQVEFPLPSIVQAIGIILLGESPQTAFFIQSLIYGLIAAFTYLVARRIGGELSAISSTLLVITIPNMLAQSVLVLPDTLLTVLCLMLLNELLQIRYRRYHIIFAFFFFILASMTKVYGVLYASAILIAALAWHYRNGMEINDKAKIAITSLIGIAVIILALILSTDSTISKVVWLGISELFSPSMHLERLLVPSPYRVHTISLLFQVGPILIGLSCLYYLKTVLSRRFTPVFFLLAIWMIIPYLVLHDIRLRYFIPLFPAFAISASRLFKDIGGGRLLVYSTGLIAFSSLFITYFLYMPMMADMKEDNIRLTGYFLDMQEGFDEVLVHTTYVNPCFNPSPLAAALDFWTQKRIVYTGREYPDAFCMNWGKDYKVPDIYERRDLPPDFPAGYSMIKEYNGGANNIMETSIIQIYRGTENLVVLISNSKTKTNTITNKKDDIVGLIEFIEPIINNMPQDQKGSITIENWGQGDMIMSRPKAEKETRIEFNVNYKNKIALEFKTGLRPLAWSDSDDGMVFRIEVDGRERFREYMDPRNKVENRLFKEGKVIIKPGKHQISFIAGAGPNGNTRWDEGGFLEPTIRIV